MPKERSLLMSEAQHTALVKVNEEPIKFDYAMTFSMRTVWSLLERGYVRYRRRSDSLEISPEGKMALERFKASDKLDVTLQTSMNERRYLQARRSIGSKGLTVAYRRNVA